MTGGTYRISSRPSDAIALAVRYGDPVPIFAHEDVLEEAGVLFEQDEDEEQIEQFREFLDQVRPEDFATRGLRPVGLRDTRQSGLREYRETLTARVPGTSLTFP